MEQNYEYDHKKHQDNSWYKNIDYEIKRDNIIFHK